MILLKRPSDARIESFLSAQQALPFSYTEVGASRDGSPPGYPVNRFRLQLGAGAEIYARAVDALRGWKMYALDWTTVCPAEAPQDAGMTIGVLAHHFGTWSLNATRIIYRIEERGSVERYGFAFGTLPGHVEQGEERFTIERRHEDEDAVWYELFAFARPKHILAWLGYPLARLIQRRFAEDSGEAMRAATGQGTYKALHK